MSSSLRKILAFSPSSVFVRVIIASSISMFSLTSACAQTSLWTTLSPKLISAYVEIKSNNESLEMAQKAASDLAAGKNPSFPTNKWADLASRYQNTARKFIDAPLPTDFDAKPFSFSFGELQNCDTRSNSLNKIQGFISALQSASSRGKDALAFLSSYSKEVDAAKDALKYIIDLHAKAMVTVPPFNDVFAWDWLELDQSVYPALSNVRTAINTQQAKIKTNLDLVNIYITNLTSNFSQLEKLSCSLAGVWKGNSTGDGRTVPMQILIKNEGGQWSGLINVNDNGDSFRDTHVNSPTITFVVGNASTPFTYSGTMSNDGTKLTGTLSSSLVNGTFKLSRTQ